MQSAASLIELFGPITNRGASDPHPVYRRLRRESPVLPVISLTGGASYLLTRYEDVRETLRHDAVFSNRANERVEVSGIHPPRPAGRCPPLSATGAPFVAQRGFPVSQRA